MGKTMEEAVKERDELVAATAGHNGSNGNGNGKPALVRTPAQLRGEILALLAGWPMERSALDEWLGRHLGLEAEDRQELVQGLLDGEDLLDRDGRIHNNTAGDRVESELDPAAVETALIEAVGRDRMVYEQAAEWLDREHGLTLMQQDALLEQLCEVGRLMDDGDFGPLHEPGKEPPPAPTSEPKRAGSERGSTESWLIRCSIGDVNWKSALERASAEEIDRALLEVRKRPESNKGRIAKLEARLRKLGKASRQEEKQEAASGEADQTSAKGYIPRRLEDIKTQLLLKLAPGRQVFTEVARRVAATFAPGGEPDRDLSLVEKAYYELEEEGRVRCIDQDGDLIELVPAMEQEAQKAAANQPKPGRDASAGPEGAEAAGQAQGEAEQRPTSEIGERLLQWLLQMRSRKPEQCVHFAKKELRLDHEGAKRLVAELEGNGLATRGDDGKLRVAATPVTRAESQSGAPASPAASDEKIPIAEAMAVAAAEQRAGQPEELDPIWEHFVWLADKEDEEKDLRNKLNIASRQYKSEYKDAMKRVKEALQDKWGDRIPQIEESLEQTARIVREGHAGIIKQARKKVAAHKIQAVKAAVQPAKPPEPPAPPQPQTANLFPEASSSQAPPAAEPAPAAPAEKPKRGRKGAKAKKPEGELVGAQA